MLKLSKQIPERWQRAYHKSPESTITEIYTLEDIELLQWRTNGRSVTNAQIFVEGNRSGSRHVQTRGLVVWTAWLAGERCEDRGGGMGEIKGSRDVCRTIQALWTLQLARRGVGSTYGWYGGRSHNVSKRLSDCGGRGRIKRRI